MPPFSFATLPTPRGRITFVFESGRTGSTVALFIHGLLQTAGHLLHWHDLLGDSIEAIYAELPGHGRCPAEGDCTIAAIADRLRMAIASFSNRPIFVIGASLGGLIALSLADGTAPAIKGVIAGDPPLVPAKQWPVRAAIDRYATSPYIRSLAEAALTPADYFDLIARAIVPTLIITGDVPLWPQRPMQGVNLIDDADIEAIRRISNPAVSVQRIAGCGHHVLAHGVTASINLVRDFCGAWPQL